MFSVFVFDFTRIRIFLHSFSFALGSDESKLLFVSFVNGCDFLLCVTLLLFLLLLLQLLLFLYCYCCFICYISINLLPGLTNCLIIFEFDLYILGRIYEEAYVKVSFYLNVRLGPNSDLELEII